jgi:hypothetical protein
MDVPTPENWEQADSSPIYGPKRRFGAPASTGGASGTQSLTDIGKIADSE